MKNQKGIAPIIILVILFAVAAGGILVWQFWPTEEPIVIPSPVPDSSPSSASAPAPIIDPAFQILEHLKAGTQLPFSEIKATTFSWQQRIKEDPLEIETLTISGYKADLTNGSIEMERDRVKVENFLKDENFVIDTYNVADGMQGSIMGFKKNDLVCMFETINQIDQEDQIKMEINCGILGN